MAVDADAAYARITGIVGRSLKAAGRRPSRLDALLHAPLPGEVDADASILGQVAVDSANADALEHARRAMSGVVSHWKTHADAAARQGDWSALARAADELSHSSASLAELEAYIADPAVAGMLVVEILPEFELVDVD